jgi:proteic killer suppression protein
LRDLFINGASAKVRPDQYDKYIRLLDALEQATIPDDLNIPGWHFHRLHGKPKRYAVAVNGPWRITFECVDGGAIDVDLEQYH